MVSLALVVCGGVGRAAAFDAYTSSPDVHRRITELALSCTVAHPVANCLETQAMRQGLGGTGGWLGGVDLPDSALNLWVLDPSPQCDNADYQDVRGYPQSRAAATAALRRCRDFAYRHFSNAVGLADGLVDAAGKPRLAGVVPTCFGFGPFPSVTPVAVALDAGCRVFMELGSALHTVQDFHAHSNWSDSRTETDPPGLGQTRPSDLFDLRSAHMPDPPKDLSTGCDIITSRSPCLPGVRVDTRYKKVFGIRIPYLVVVIVPRVTHGKLNKDGGHWSS